MVVVGGWVMAAGEKMRTADLMEKGKGKTEKDLFKTGKVIKMHLIEL